MIPDVSISIRLVLRTTDADRVAAAGPDAAGQLIPDAVGCSLLPLTDLPFYGSSIIKQFSQKMHMMLINADDRDPIIGCASFGEDGCPEALPALGVEFDCGAGHGLDRLV